MEYLDIIESSTPPKDTSALWYYNGNLKGFINGEWVKICKSIDPLILGINGNTSLTSINNFYEQLHEEGLLESYEEVWDYVDWHTTPNLYLRYFACADTSITSIDVSRWDLTNCTDIAGAFFKCKNLVEIKGIEDLKLGPTTNIYGIFNQCESMPSYDLHKWDVSQMNNLANLWNQNKKMTYLNISGWDFGNSTRLDGTFYYCWDLVTIVGPIYNLGKLTNSFPLQATVSLSEESIQVIIDGLYDKSGTSNTYNITMHSYLIERLTDAHLAQITAKGWTIVKNNG